MPPNMTGRRTITRSVRQVTTTGRGLATDRNVVVAVNTPDEEREPIVTQQPEQEQEQALSQDELEAQGGEELPDREAMSLVNANIAVPVNAAVAANVLSDDAVAYADATQDAYIDQSQ